MRDIRRFQYPTTGQMETGQRACKPFLLPVRLMGQTGNAAGVRYPAAKAGFTEKAHATFEISSSLTEFG